MQLSLRTFNTLVQSMAAAVEASATQLLDLTVGSTLRAVLEANASIGLWMQWLILQVLRTTRAATSSGADLDSWMADLTLTRLPAVAATGIVTFSRFTPGMSALIPAGALVRTADGTQTFAVSADTSQACLVGDQQWLHRGRRRCLAGCAGDRTDAGQRRQRAGRHNLPAGIGHPGHRLRQQCQCAFRMASTPSRMMHSGVASETSSPAARAPRRSRWVTPSAAFSRD